jgi:NAD(P)-dependent dehydrogenase (short-subunit alcohol dehydrogenase family)
MAGPALELDGAVALVTGAAAGIGAAMVDALRRAGATVLGADLPGRGADLEVDVTDAPAVTRATAEVIAHHGRLDVVASNAGVAVAGPVEDLTLDDWARVIDVNVIGAVNTVVAAYPALARRGTGHLLFTASLAGLLPTPLLVPYATAKSAIVGLATSLRPEAARHGVGVSVLCPGPVQTGLLTTGGVGGAVRGGVDSRRFLVSAAGPALSADSVAAAAVEGIRRNRAVIAPGRAGLLWRAARLSPALAERAVVRAMRRELEQIGRR